VMVHREEPALDGPDSAMPVLLHELGVAQSWLGDLADAEANLTLAVGQSRSRGLHAFAVSSLSHLALTEYMAGREHACVELAQEALTLGRSPAGGRSLFSSHRATLALLLGELADVAAPARTTTRREPGQRIHSADLTTQLWSRMRDARLELMAGSAAAAEQVLETPGEYAELAEVNLPDHLRSAVLVERAVLAALSSDRSALRSLAEALESAEARGEAALVEGLRADLDGDRRRAVAAFERAAADAAYSQPPTRAIALACQAQMLDALGQADAALRCLETAVTETEVRRNATPFLGWTRQGTPMRALLARLAKTSRSRWVRELTEARAEIPDVMTSYRASTPTPRERETSAKSVVRPLLSPREREVLGELARGATYADIAASLFVSENTVKTHVSSLYGKLAVSRRSDALAVARGLDLL
jgi:LuxR family transcriptional regulator, maltose regulon positive regulatory protein